MTKEEAPKLVSEAKLAFLNADGGSALEALSMLFVERRTNLYVLPFA